MRHYRVYLLRGRTERSYRCLDFHARNDEAALEFVKRRQGREPLELWSQGLRIARLEPVT